MSARRTERLLNLLLALLATRRGLSREELRRAVPGYAECSTDAAFERMFERDKDDLRDLGVPVRSVPLRGYGDGGADAYRVDATDYALPDLRLTAAETAVLGLAARVWQETTFAGPAARALVKLRALGVSADPGQVLGAEPRIAIAERAFAPLHEAIRDRRPITFSYRRSDGSRSTRRVEPWRLLLRKGRWYVVGHDRDRAEPRLFRLGRVVGRVRPLGVPGEVRAPDETAIAEAARHIGLRPGATARGGETPDGSPRPAGGSPDGGAPAGRGREPSGPGQGEPAHCDAAVVLVRAGRGGRVRARASRGALTPPPPTEQTPAGFDVLRLPLADGAGLVEDLAALAGDVLVREPEELVARVHDAWAAVLDR